MFKCLLRPLLFVGALVFPLVIMFDPLINLPANVGACRLRKVHGDDRDICTPAYLNPIKVMTVKILLGTRVMALDLPGHFVLLRLDNGVATTCCVFETFAVGKPDATANRFDKFTVLQLICGLRDSRAACSEQTREELLRDAQLGCFHPVVNH